MDRARTPLLSIDAPNGVRVWREAPRARDGGYRDASAPPAVVLERRWRSIWGGVRGVFLTLWGCGFAAGGLAAIFGDGWRPSQPPLPLGLVFVAIGVTGVYVGVAILANRTRVRITPGEIELTEGQLPWPGGFSLPNDAPSVFAVRAPYNTIRNGAGRWPAPEVSQVHLTCGARTEVVFPQCPDAADASVLVRALREAIQAAAT
jgi:hypothetical protein